MEALTIDVEVRATEGKGGARRLRQQGKTPGIFYGPGVTPMPVAVATRDFTIRLAKIEGTHLIELRSADSNLDKKMVLLREVQTEPLRGGVLHVDFYEVALDREIQVKVPLHFVGKAAGVTLGGILQPIFRELTVSCLPTQIPESISVDVAALSIHESIHISAVQLPAGAKVVFDADEAVVTVLPPTQEIKPVAAEGAAAVVAGAEDAKKPEAKGDAKKTDAKKPDAKKPDAKK